MFWPMWRRVAMGIEFSTETGQKAALQQRAVLSLSHPHHSSLLINYIESFDEIKNAVAMTEKTERIPLFRRGSRVKSTLTSQNLCTFKCSKIGFAVCAQWRTPEEEINYFQILSSQTSYRSDTEYCPDVQCLEAGLKQHYVKPEHTYSILIRFSYHFLTHFRPMINDYAHQAAAQYRQWFYDCVTRTKSFRRGLAMIKVLDFTTVRK